MRDPDVSSLEVMLTLRELAWSAAQPQQNERPDGWTVLKEWSGGPGSIDTDRFTTAAPAFRVVWTLKDLGRGGILDLIVRDAAGKLIKTGISLQSKDTTSEQGSGAGRIDVRGGPGDYYLEIRSAGVEWTVAVEQPRKNP